MKVIPFRYDQLDISKSEKQLIETLKSSYENNHNSHLLLGTSPVGISNLHVFISDSGLVFIEPYSINNIKLINVIRPGVEASIVENKKKLYNRLTQHKKLKVKTQDGQFLKFPFTYKIFLTEISGKDAAYAKLSNEDKVFLEQYCIYKDSKPTEDNMLFKLLKGFNQTNDLSEAMFSNVDNPYWKEWKGFSEVDVNNILQMISPEYTIPVPDDEEEDEQEENLYDINNIENEEIYRVCEEDFNVNVHRLDDEQIKIINSMRKGNQLILACAGSGKSVILISKAFKAASLHTDKDFLILCYNRNLAQFYNWKMSIAGYRERNVVSMTFHKLLQKLLQESGIQYDRMDHESNFEKAKKALVEGKIKRRFYGIFLDEIQVFKPEWYEFCYSLLENHKRDNYFFTICGDISQNINRNIKKGKAPWQASSDSDLPKYTGRSLRIEKNYRNSIEINNMMQNYMEISKSYFKKYNIPLDNEEDSYLVGKAFRKSEKPRIVLSDRFKVADAVVDEIKRLNIEKKVPLNRICILFPYRQHKLVKYYIMNWIQNKLNENFIDYYQLIVGQDGTLPAMYGNNKGVAISTIESSLGLDFDAVILTGLLPMGYMLNTKKERILESNNGNNDDKNQDFVDNVNKIYTACTRARDYLTVILEEDEGKSIYSKMIIDSTKEV
ncbi:MAG: AAA family ATPase [Tenericutes bacterium]|nr:AAA family ATPase [Mycoplasmatota bacterium]